jgi:hypothetical protein
MTAIFKTNRAFGILISLTAAALGACSSTGSSSDGETSESIVGGTPVPITAYPATGFIAASAPNVGSVTCTAEVISGTAILTAAHCTEVTAFAAQYGVETYFGFVNAANAPFAVVTRLTAHPGYIAATGENDVAIGILNKAIPGHPAATIAAPAALQAGCGFYDVGYGQDAPGVEGAGGGFLDRNGSAMCIDDVDDFLALVAGDPGSACFGDSGGALYVTGTKEIVAIASRRSADCEPGDGVLYVPMINQGGFVSCAEKSGVPTTIAACMLKQPVQEKLVLAETSLANNAAAPRAFTLTGYAANLYDITEPAVVTSVDVYIDVANAAHRLGAATLGEGTTALAAFGERFDESGWSLPVNLASQKAGKHTLIIVANGVRAVDHVTEKVHLTL